MALDLRLKKEKLPLFLGVSLLCHLLLLSWMGRLTSSPLSRPREVHLDLEIERASPSPPAATRPNPPQEIKKRPHSKPLPRERDFSPAIPITKQEAFKLFEENLAAEKQAPPQPTEPLRTHSGINHEPGVADHLQKQPPDSAGKKPPDAALFSEAPPVKRPRYAIETKELFRWDESKSAKKERAADKPGKRADFGAILSQLDKHLEVENYGDAGYAGEGVLAFADSNFKALWYGRIVKKKVVDGWFPPYAARVLGLTGRSVVTFRILRNGEISDVTLKESSGNRSLDMAALNAVKNSPPFPSLPADYNYDTLGVIFSFWYNLESPVNS